MQLPTLRYEEKLWNSGYELVIGVDEVGRGSLAGPVSVAAVVFKPFCLLSPKTIKIADSKQLSPTARTSAEEWIRENCLCCVVRSADERFIDRYGIVKATHKAFRSAIKSILTTKVATKPFLLVDAFPIRYVKGIGLRNQYAIIKGDVKVFSIAAASILAKIYRDRLMKKLSRKFPLYGWGRNKGYGTEEHIMAIGRYGLTKHHRRTFIKF